MGYFEFARLGRAEARAKAHSASRVERLGFLFLTVVSDRETASECFELDDLRTFADCLREQK